MHRGNEMSRLLTSTVAVLVVAVLGAVAFDAPAAASGAPAPDTVDAAGRSTYPGDFVRVLQLIADLRADPPTDPLVCLLGGSSARECTVSDRSWSRAVSRLRGHEVRCVNLGSKHRLFTQDRRLVRYLPAGTGVVFIGVNPGRFCNGRSDPPVVLPPPRAASSRGLDRRGLRSSTVTWTDQRKRRAARLWMVQRWPKFRRRWKNNMRVLELVCKESLRRGQHPVIIDLPRNMAIIGRQLDQPLRLYHRACRRLAARLGIPYVQFQAGLGLTNRDFSDLWHTVRSGQVKWEQALVKTTARLLKKYAIEPPPTPSPDPDAGPSGPDPPATPEG